jgi:hypothetical protein
MALLKYVKCLRPYRFVAMAAGMLSKSLAKPKAATTVPYAVRRQSFNDERHGWIDDTDHHARVMPMLTAIGHICR